MKPWALIAIGVLSTGCKTIDEKLCDTSTDTWKAAQEELVTKGLRSPATADEISAERRRCIEAVDRLKTGPKDCVAKCYAHAASGRDALIDCDTKCSVSVQAP